MFRKRHLLIVEDEIMIALSMKKALKLYDLEVVDIVKSHDEAMEALKKHNVDLILMDINIKGNIDGIQSCNIIHYQYNIPTIFVSGFYDYETLELIQQSCAYGYISKPFIYEQLYMQIYFVLNHQHENQPTPEDKKITLSDEFSFCTEKLTLYYQNREINLTKKERILVSVLCKNKNNYVSYESLFSQVWEEEEFCLNKIRGSIFRIKRKLPLLKIHNSKEHGYTIL
ncbi:response regulator [Candidatus Marinarcus aquaticus]|nr:response regulator [Candidatus Marinarcus aquaticus]